MFARLTKVVRSSLLTVWVNVQVVLLSLTCKRTDRQKVKSLIRYRVKKIEQNSESDLLEGEEKTDRHLQSLLRHRNKRVQIYKKNRGYNIPKQYQYSIKPRISKNLSYFKDAIQLTVPTKTKLHKKVLKQQQHESDTHQVQPYNQQMTCGIHHENDVIHVSS